MSPRWGDLVAPPSVGTEYTLRFGNNEAAKGWEDLCRSAAGNLRRCFEALRDDPRPYPSTSRHHRLEGTLAIARHQGRVLERWQFEVTGGGRVWYLVDPDRRVVWAGTSHPKLTDLPSCLTG